MDREVFIVPPSEAGEQRRYVSRPCESASGPCDHCDLQARCEELFGKRGERCKILDRDLVWMDITDVPEAPEVTVRQQLPKEFAWSHVSIRRGDYGQMIDALGDVANELEGPGQGFTGQELLKYFDVRVLQCDKNAGSCDITLLIHSTSNTADILDRLRARMPECSIRVTCYGVSGESIRSFEVSRARRGDQLVAALDGTLKILRTIKAEAERADIAYSGDHIPIPARCEYALDTYGWVLDQWKGTT